jgi:hypothetical protein
MFDHKRSHQFLPHFTGSAAADCNQVLAQRRAGVITAREIAIKLPGRFGYVR